MNRQLTSPVSDHTGAATADGDWTVAGLAAWYGVEPDVILAYILAGTLKATKLAPASKSPSWRILSEDHAEFEVAHGHELSWAAKQQ